MGIFSRLFGGRPAKGQAHLSKVESTRDRSEERKHRPKDVDLDAAEYVPLPPSPSSWELTPEHEEPEYPEHLLPIVSAARQRKYTKVLRLAKDLASEDLQGPAGEFVAAAYRETVHKRRRSGQLRPAARWAHEMLERVASHCDDTDRRRFNKILKDLEREGIRHGYEPFDVAPPKREPLFVASAGSPWRLVGERRLPMEERPDAALKIVSFTADGVVYGDFAGKSNEVGPGQGRLIKRGHRGEVVAERRISHDAYRVGVGPNRAGLAIMDSEGGLHVYGSDLQPTVQRALQTDPRVQEHFRSTETNYWGQFRTQVRAVDVNADGEWHLFTLADEAWCCSAEGDAKWGVRMPLNEGWERVVARTDRRSVGADVEAALASLGLELPVSPSDVKRAYRNLALRHHPDRNPGSTNAVRKMQEINQAFEVLTGVDPTTIDVMVEEEEVTYFRQVRPDHVTAVGGIRVEMWGMSGPAQDWIYGAAFAAEGSGAFLATYSGKVVEVDETGEPLRVYDLGTVPQEIVDTGEHLYFLTPTRLYVLRGRDRLVSFLDVFRKGRLFFSSAGFALLDKKSFTWFEPDGSVVGSIATRDPIRAMYDSPQGCVLQTRQHEVTVEGLRVGGD